MQTKPTESPMLRILILTALPQEYAPLKKLIPGWRRLTGRPYKSFLVPLPGRRIVLMECGMGGDAVRNALERGRVELNPDVVVFAGFAGGLHPSLAAGDVCVVRDALLFDSLRGNAGTVASFSLGLGPEFSKFASDKALKCISAVTAPQPENKTALAARLGNRPAALDMETADVAEIACRDGLAFVCFRAVSDGLSDDLGFDVAEISDSKGNVKIWRVLGTILRNPFVLGAYYRAWRRSRVAAENLCRVLTAFLDIPVGSMRRIKERALVARV